MRMLRTFLGTTIVLFGASLAHAQIPLSGNMFFGLLASWRGHLHDELLSFVSTDIWVYSRGKRQCGLQWLGSIRGRQIPSVDWGGSGRRPVLWLARVHFCLQYRWQSPVSHVAGQGKWHSVHILDRPAAFCSRREVHAICSHLVWSWPNK
jgi:hypothetical protein